MECTFAHSLHRAEQSNEALHSSLPVSRPACIDSLVEALCSLLAICWEQLSHNRIDKELYGKCGVLHIRACCKPIPASSQMCAAAYCRILGRSTAIGSFCGYSRSSIADKHNTHTRASVAHNGCRNTNTTTHTTAATTAHTPPPPP